MDSGENKNTSLLIDLIYCLLRCLFMIYVQFDDEIDYFGYLLSLWKMWRDILDFISLFFDLRVQTCLFCIDFLRG